MAESWRIFVVEDDEVLNQTIVNSLRKDGYMVRGAKTAAEAMRTLWLEEYDVVVCDLKTPGVDSFELLQWLRTYRPNLRVIMVGSIDAVSYRTLALENGAAGYLERPLDLHLLKEELRRLSQQTGFSANLDSFDLLDVIQIITMSRKNIALLINTGLEEHGTLRFLNGALVWAEYGALRGEEAFFALAAHKNGTVVYQSWSEQITPNVTLPLSRLIFQALQYRTKYANMQLSGEQIAMQSKSSGVDTTTTTMVEEDDTPFQVLVEYNEQERDTPTPATPIVPVASEEVSSNGVNAEGSKAKEWWEQTGKFSGLTVSSSGIQAAIPGNPSRSHPPSDKPAAITRPLGKNAITQTNGNSGTSASSAGQKTPTGPRTDLPSWLTDQPTSSDLSAVQPSSLSSTSQLPVSSLKPAPAEWQTPRSLPKKSDAMAGKQTTSAQPLVQQATSPEWQPSEDMTPVVRRSGPLQSLSTVRRAKETPSVADKQESGQWAAVNTTGVRRGIKRNYNYPSLVSALQTLGYSINGFIAAAVVSLEGQPIAQVAVDDLDIAPMCKHFSGILKGVVQSLDQGAWGGHEETIITSAERHILMRMVGSEKDTFLVLITTRESDSLESLAVMANVEGAITTALR